MKVVVLGAFGQLGSDLRVALARQDVVALGRADFDVRDAAKARAILGEIRPDAIVNTTAFHKVEACETEPEAAFGVNAVAAASVARIARELGARLVHVSTDYVFGGTDARPLSEDVPPAPVQVYGASKAAGEWLVQLAHPDALIIRSSGLFGVVGAAGKGGNFIETVLRLAREHGEMRIVHDQVTSPTYTADLAAAIVMLLERGATGIMHVTNAGSCSWHDLAAHVVASTGLDARVHPITTRELGGTVRRPGYSALENARWREMGLPALRSWSRAVGAYLEAKHGITSERAGPRGARA